MRNVISLGDRSVQGQRRIARATPSTMITWDCDRPRSHSTAATGGVRGPKFADSAVELTRVWVRRARRVARLLCVTVSIAAFGWSVARGAEIATTASFASLVERLSEPGGDFGGDNLISNEQSYLHVMPALQSGGVSGGAYIGVGPDQNFSYIAQIKPAIAYIIDIRRDNLLLHLLFKALFAEAPTRVEYLGLLTGRPLPDRTDSWRDATIDRMIAYIDGADALPDQEQERIQTRLERTIRDFGVPLTADDLKTIATSRQQFVTSGLSLVFQVRGQPPRSYYPTFRTLLRETDRLGHQLGFLASEPAYQFVRSLQARHLIVPVVGDVSGPQAMRAIGADMVERGVALSAFYISNVEYYLFRGGSFGRYAENLQRLPHNERSTVIRSVFPSGGSLRLPQSVPGFYSTSIIQPFDAMLEDLAARKYHGYQDLILASSRLSNQSPANTAPR